ATLTGLLGTSAWYAPGAASASMVEAIINDQKRIIPGAVLLEGEYGQKDLVIGVPVLLGKGGWEKIVDFPLSADEKEAFKASADATRKVNQILYDSKIL
ncbi:MAG: malate dehydrogenase, partial [Tannerella sp.]|nr:malate dehydrogenase [Tannerella sp.]